MAVFLKSTGVHVLVVHCSREAFRCNERSLSAPKWAVQLREAEPKRTESSHRPAGSSAELPLARLESGEPRAVRAGVRHEREITP